VPTASKIRMKTPWSPSSTLNAREGDYSVKKLDKKNLHPLKTVTASSSASNSAEIVWKNIFLFIFLHSSLFYSLYALIFEWPWRTLLFATILGMGSGLGVTVGAHRLWSHRSYKARLPLRIFLAVMQTVAGQVCLIKE